MKIPSTNLVQIIDAILLAPSHKMVRPVLVTLYRDLSTLTRLVVEVQFLRALRFDRFEIAWILRCHRVVFLNPGRRETTRLRGSDRSVQGLNRVRQFRLVRLYGQSFAIDWEPELSDKLPEAMEQARGSLDDRTI